MTGKNRSDEIRVVGINRRGYPERRNFVDLPLSRYRFKRVPDMYSAWSWIKFRTAGKLDDRYLNSFRDGGLGRCDLYHFFNALSYGKRPWVSTFETRLPRWGACSEERMSEGIKLMAGDACKRLVALSECTARIQRRHVLERFPVFAPVLDEKMIVLHPAQPVLWDPTYEKPPMDQRVRFAFIGRDFFRKGGAELMAAFSHLYDSGYRNWSLTIVSGMAWGDYASRSDASDLHRARQWMTRFKDHVVHHQDMANREVLSMLRDSHVGLLPTWADTYGYSVLECQASGCPVISTDIRALPEINDDRTGWLVTVPKDDLGMGRIHGDERRQFRKQLLDGLIPVLEAILADPGQVLHRREAAAQRIASDHSPGSRAKALEAVYDSALMRG